MQPEMSGRWVKTPESEEYQYVADSTGEIALPNFPGNLTRSGTDWGLKLTGK